MGVGDRDVGYPFGVVQNHERSDPMSEHFDSHNAAAAFDHDSTLVVAVELSGKSWEVGAVVPGVARRPRRRLDPRDMAGLLRSRSGAHTSEPQSPMRISSAVFVL